jgi:hypothetical protein
LIFIFLRRYSIIFFFRFENRLESPQHSYQVGGVL